MSQTINVRVKDKLNESRNKTDMIQTASGEAVKQATVHSSTV